MMRQPRGLRTPCKTSTLVNTCHGRRFAQAALKPCGSLEERRDLAICPTFMFLNAEPAACGTSRQLEKLVEWAEKGSDPLFAQQVRQLRHVRRDSTCLVLGKQLPLAAERGEPNFTGRRKFGTMT